MVKSQAKKSKRSNSNSSVPCIDKASWLIGVYDGGGGGLRGKVSYLYHALMKVGWLALVDGCLGKGGGKSQGQK